MNTKTIWEYVTQHQPFTVSAVAAALAIDDRQVRNAFHKWHKQGVIQQINSGRRNKLYMLTSHSAPRLGQGNHSTKRHKQHNSRQLIWNALKIMRKLTLDDVLMVTDSGISSARDYLNALEKCGYVQGVTALGRSKTWKLINYSGRYAPAHIRGKGVFDKNLKTMVAYSTKP